MGWVLLVISEDIPAPEIWCHKNHEQFCRDMHISLIPPKRPYLRGGGYFLNGVISSL